MTEQPGARYRYLLGAMQQLHITMTVRMQAVPEEVERLPEIVERWRRASAQMQELAAGEPGAGDRIRVEETPAELADRQAPAGGMAWRRSAQWHQMGVCMTGVHSGTPPSRRTTGGLAPTDEGE